MVSHAKLWIFQSNTDNSKTKQGSHRSSAVHVVTEFQPTESVKISTISIRTMVLKSGTESTLKLERAVATMSEVSEEQFLCRDGNRESNERFTFPRQDKENVLDDRVRRHPWSVRRPVKLVFSALTVSISLLAESRMTIFHFDETEKPWWWCLWSRYWITSKILMRVLGEQRYDCARSSRGMIMTRSAVKRKESDSTCNKCTFLRLSVKCGSVFSVSSRLFHLEEDASQATARKWHELLSFLKINVS